jgi:hypothetical protein
MNRLLVRSACLIALAAGVATFAAGCSSSNTSADSVKAHAAINAAADKSMRQGSAQIAMTTTQKVGTDVSDTKAGGAVAFDGSTGRLLLLLPSAKTRIEEIVANGVIYLRLTAPSLPKAVQGKWIKVKMSDTKTLQKLGVSGLPPVGSILQQLKTVGGTAADTGKVTVAGKVFTKYVVTITREELVKKAEGIYGKGSASVKALQAAPADTHATVTIYINTDGVVSREVEELAIPVSGKSSKTTTDIALANYGTPISTATPPAKDTIDGASLFVKKN